MKKMVLLSTFFSITAVGVYGLAKKHLFYQAPPLNAQKTSEEKHLVVVTPTYNNRHFCERNLTSLFSQRHGDGPYKNWSLILVDDCSTDGQFELIQKCVKDHGMEVHCKLIRNKTRQGAAYNIHSMINSIPNNNAIVLCVDGDDWLAHDRVFERINEIYQDPSVWLTYGQYIYWPDYNRAPTHSMPRLINHKKIRDYDFFASHLRTFYAGLFKKVRLESLKYSQGWLPDVDVAIMWPMMEMAGPSRIRWVPEVLYVYNRAQNYTRTDPSHYGRLTQQQRNEIICSMRKQPAYEQLASLETVIS